MNNIISFALMTQHVLLSRNIPFARAGSLCTRLTPSKKISRKYMYFMMGGGMSTIILLDYFCTLLCKKCGIVILVSS